jgi:electron transfer flavoprotein alpha subunit
MAVDKIWVIIESQDGKVIPLSLELLTKARQLTGTVEGVTWGDADAIAAEVGAYGATTLYSVGDLGAVMPGPSVAATGRC